MQINSRNQNQAILGQSPPGRGGTNDPFAPYRAYGFGPAAQYSGAVAPEPVVLLGPRKGLPYALNSPSASTGGGPPPAQPPPPAPTPAPREQYQHRQQPSLSFLFHRDPGYSTSPSAPAAAEQPSAPSAAVEQPAAPVPGLVGSDVAGWVRGHWTNNYNDCQGRYAQDNGYEGGTRNITEEYQKQDRWEWLSQRLQSLKTTLYNCQDAIGQAQTRQKTAADKMQSLTGEQRSNQSQISWKQGQLHQLRTELSTLERNQDAVQEEIDRLKHQIRSLEGQIDMNDDDLARHNFAVQQKENEKARRRDWEPDNPWGHHDEWELNGLHQERDHFKRWYINEPRRKIAHAEEQISQLKGRLPGGDWRRSQLVGQIANLEREIQALESRQDAIQTEYDELKAEHDKLAQKVWDLQNQYQSANNEFGTREQEVKALGFSYY
ncbi:MAG: hypothetical protein HY319_08325 [Armatimonadetes bacterium]|nr:hypothetical protein [Armatimonadota bacterium]